MYERLSLARRRRFVGRTAETELFAGLLREPELSTVVLFVHGPAGVGKTTLLRRFSELAQQAGVRCLELDGRDLAPVAEAVTDRAAPLLAGDPGRSVLLLDTYELLEDLDRWLREDLLPRIPADTLVVIAGQNPPAAGWAADPGWAELLRTVRLGNLSPDDCREYLSRRGIAEAEQGGATAFTHGHPLALALVTEVLQARGGFAAEEEPDVIKALLDRLLDQVPSPRHRAAVEAAALVRATTEPLLAALLEEAEPGELFAWLRGLPFIEAGPGGLHPHDLAREVLAADLQWRDPERFVAVHDRARQHYLSRLHAADPSSQPGVLHDLMYLHTQLRPLLHPGSVASGLRVEPATPADRQSIRAMVAEHEGEASAAWAAHWQQGWQLVRDGAGQAVGACCLLNLPELGDTDDPAVVAARRELANHPPLRPGERATLVRFWLARDSYQAISPVQSLIAAQLARHYLSTASLAVTLLPVADPDAWADFCSYADQARMPVADFTVGARSYGVYGHDWRVVPPDAWVALLSRRQTGAAPAREHPQQPLLVLGEAEFAAAVRRALRDFTRPERLRGNALLAARLVTGRVADGAGAAERLEVLREVIRDAAGLLRSSPADERLYRVLHRAYLAPAPSLERAAEALDLPSSTFRRHLGAAVERITGTLWHQELDA